MKLHMIFLCILSAKNGYGESYNLGVKSLGG